MDPNPAMIDRLKAQIAQLDGLIAEGVLSGEAAKTTRDDLERQLLQAVLASAPAATSDAIPAAPPRVRAPRSLVTGIAAFVLVFGAAGYAWMGNKAGWDVGPGSPGSAPVADAATEAAQIDALIQRLEERLKAQPDDAEGWAMLGRTYTAQSRFPEALAAYKRVLDLKPGDAQALADYADGLAVVNNRSLDGEPEKLILQAVKADPNNLKALALAGTVSFNRSDYRAAVDYWERAMKAGDPNGEFAKQLQGALNEARQRAGLPPAAPASAAAGPFAAATANPAPVAPGASAAVQPGAEAISGRVTLKDSLKGQVGPDDTVFIFARAPSGSKMPLAILRKKVSDLPLDFKLDDSLAMSPAARLSSASQVVVGARISKTGNAMPSPGDWQVLSAPVALGAQGVKVEIGEAVR